MGYRGVITVAAVAFVVRIAVLGALGVDLAPPLWGQALLIVLIVELASISISVRGRPIDVVRDVARGLAVALSAAALSEAMMVFLDSAGASGVLVRAAGIAAAVVAIGWATRVWRRSRLGG
jgi:hypothetical protein